VAPEAVAWAVAEKAVVVSVAAATVGVV